MGGTEPPLSRGRQFGGESPSSAIRVAPSGNSWNWPVTWKRGLVAPLGIPQQPCTGLLGLRDWPELSAGTQFLELGHSSVPGRQLASEASREHLGCVFYKPSAPSLRTAGEIVTGKRSAALVGAQGSGCRSLVAEPGLQTGGGPLWGKAERRMEFLEDLVGPELRNNQPQSCC